MNENQYSMQQSNNQEAIENWVKKTDSLNNQGPNKPRDENSHKVKTRGVEHVIINIVFRLYCVPVFKNFLLFRGAPQINQLKSVVENGIGYY